MAQLPTPARKKAQVAFATAVMLLCLTGLAAYFSIARLTSSQKWVVHTYEVQAALGNVDSAALDAERDRADYVITGNSAALNDFEAAIANIYQALRHLRELTKDNLEQQQMCTRLEEIMARRIALFRDSIDLKKANPKDQRGESNLSARALPLVSDATATLQQMRDTEQRLLIQRARASKHLFTLAVVVLMVAFILALLMFRALPAACPRTRCP